MSCFSTATYRTRGFLSDGRSLKTLANVHSKTLRALVKTAFVEHFNAERRVSTYCVRMILFLTIIIRPCRDGYFSNSCTENLNKRTIISEQIINFEDADQTQKKHPKPIYSIPSNKKIRLFESSKIPKSNLSLARTFCSFHRSVPILFVKSARVKFHKISPVKTTCKPVKLSATVCRRGTDLNACA